MKRQIDIKGAYNLRDLGGLSTQNGKTIKRGKIFRAGQITRIPDTEFDKLAALNIQTICDFRTTKEQTASPDRWHNLEQINRCSLPVGEGRMDTPWQEKVKMGLGKESYLYKANRSYVETNFGQFKSFFKLLLDERNYPLLFHCTAGKDRTGFAAAILLHILGVDKETILEDYLLTNEFVEWFRIKMSVNPAFDFEAMRPILIADLDYIQGVYDAIAEHYGTMNAFLEQALEIGDKEIQQLKTILLEE